MAELVDTVLTLAVALVGWIVFLATVAAILVTAAAVTGAWAVRGAWRWLQARMPRRGAPRGSGAPQGPSRVSRGAREAPRSAQSRSARPVPSWAHTEPYTYEEAA